MKHIPIPLTMILIFGCATKARDSGAELQEDYGDDGSQDEGDGSSATAGDASDGGTDDGGTSNGETSDGEESNATDGSGSDDGSGDDSGGADGGGADSVGDIEIAGTYWNASLAANYTITNEDITETKSPPPVASIVTWSLSTYNNEDRYAVAATPTEYWAGGGGWTRFDWTVDGSNVYLCLTVTDAADEATALATETADASDIAEGCPDLMGWMLLTPA